MIGRRTFLKATSLATVAATTARPLIGSSSAQSKASTELLARIDHLVYVTPDLNLGIEKLEDLFGVRATPGGQHQGRGTRNALIALGPSIYLEIFGIDPEQPKPERPRGFGIDDLKAPKLAAWVANGTNLDQLVSDAALQGVNLGAILSGNRKRGDGLVLSWRFTDPSTVVADRIVPIFIDWGQTPHPALSAPQGLTLIDFRAEHPDPKPIQKMLSQLGFALPVEAGSRPALIATITGPRGALELR